VCARIVEHDAALPTVLRGLGRARTRLSELAIGSSDWRAIRKWLERTYRNGRAAMAEATRDASDENLHEWRKRAKDLRYQLEFLCKAWPGVIDAAADGAHDLGDLLGDDHDLALLRRLLDGKLRNSVESGERRSLLRAIGKRREVLQSDAADLGQRVYVESPRRFVGRVHEYWKAWR